MDRGDLWVLLPVELFDLCRVDESHGTAAAALFALAAPPPVLTDTAAAAVLALAAPPSVFADATAAALLAIAALPPVLADATAAALLAPAALPLVLAEAAAAALLADDAPPPVLALLVSHFHVRTAGPRCAPRAKTVLERSPAQRVWVNNGVISQIRGFCASGGAVPGRCKLLA